MLMEGMLPAIGGIHADLIQRSREDKQPNYGDNGNTAKHAMMLVGDCSITKFYLGESVFDEVPLGQKVYKVYDGQIRDLSKAGKLREFVIPTRTIVYFDCFSWHEAQIATKAGWRFFIRATINSNRQPTNEIRRQTQVYVESFRESW